LFGQKRVKSFPTNFRSFLKNSNSISSNGNTREKFYYNNLIEETLSFKNFKEAATLPSPSSDRLAQDSNNPNGNPSDVIKEFRDMFLENYLGRNKIGRKSKESVKAKSALSTSCPDSRTRNKIFIRKSAKTHQSQNIFDSDYCQENNKNNHHVDFYKQKPDWLKSDWEPHDGDSYRKCTYCEPVFQTSTFKRHNSSMDDIHELRSKMALNFIDHDPSLINKLLQADDIEVDTHTNAQTTTTTQTIHNVEVEINNLKAIDWEFDNLFAGIEHL
jgi:hypothetical protein